MRLATTIAALALAATVDAPAWAAVNVAPGGTATQSSTAYAGPEYNGSGPASRAIDGNRNGDYYAGSVTHSGFLWPNPEPNAWWQVQLAGDVKVQEVLVFSRTDSQAEVFARLGPFRVELYDGASMVAFADYAADVFVPTITATNVAGRGFTFSDVVADRVRIQKTDTNWLHLAEVEVMAAPVPEPHEWAMMLAGLGVVGLVARRRRRA
jgi:hypothetical protein